MYYILYEDNKIKSAYLVKKYINLQDLKISNLCIIMLIVLILSIYIILIDLLMSLFLNLIIYAFATLCLMLIKCKKWYSVSVIGLYVLLIVF